MRWGVRSCRSIPPTLELETHLQHFLDGRFDLKAGHLWLLVLGRYCRKTPFYFYQAARSYLESARDLAPLEWMGRASLGVLLLLEGERERGLQELREAARLRGEPLDPEEDRLKIPMLEAALGRARLPVEVIVAP